MNKKNFIKKMGSIILAGLVSLPIGPFQVITQTQVLQKHLKMV